MFRVVFTPMSSKFYVSLILAYLPVSSCLPRTHQPLVNITITAPNGTSNHGYENLLCTPTKWSDIAVFFLANYVSHAATVKSLPGEPVIPAFIALVFALLFPVSGISRGLDAIRQKGVFCDNPVEAASRAGALCTVVRSSEWKPQIGDKVRNVVITGPRTSRFSRTLDAFSTRDNAQTSNRDMGTELDAVMEGQDSQGDSTLRSSTESQVDQAVDQTHLLHLIISIGRSSPVLSELSIFTPATSMLSSNGRKVHEFVHFHKGMRCQFCLQEHPCLTSKAIKFL